MIELVEIAIAAVGGTAVVCSAAWRSRVAEWRERYDRAVAALQEQQDENRALERAAEDVERAAALRELRALKRAAKAAGVKLTKPKRRTGKAKR